MWQVYIVKCNDKTFYTGVAKDLKRRIDEHNNSKLGAKYTRPRRPVKLVYSNEFETRSEAQIEECRIKQLTRPQKKNLILK